MKHTSINSVEAFFVVLLVFFIEIGELLLNFIPIIGTFAGIFTNLLTWFFIHIWLILKGARWDYFAVAGVIEFIPLINGFFTKTIILIGVIILHNNPTLNTAVRASTGKFTGKQKTTTPSQSSLKV